MKKYIRNMETGKIEIHMEKEVYLTLSKENKKLIKSNFLFSRWKRAWISRSKEPNLNWAIEVARELGFTEEERVGKRLSFAEQMERKAEKAEARAERYEIYAENAAKRGGRLQAEFKEYRGDISFLTQPVIAGHSGSERFGKQRDRIMERYGKGFEEYRKSEEFRRKAEKARLTAGQKKMKNPAYLNRRIEECKRKICNLNKNVEQLEKVIDDLKNGREVDSIYDRHNPQRLLIDMLERLETEIDKQAYYQNALEEIGGILYNRENVKVGYIVRIRRGEYEVLKTNPKTVRVRCVSTGFDLTYDYPEIQEIVKAIEVKPKKAETHPYHEGEILVTTSIGSERIITAYEIIRSTKMMIYIQQIRIEEGKPVPGAFLPGSKPKRKKPKICTLRNRWAVFDGWELHKYKA